MPPSKEGAPFKERTQDRRRKNREEKLRRRVERIAAQEKALREEIRKLRGQEGT